MFIPFHMDGFHKKKKLSHFIQSLLLNFQF